MHKKVWYARCRGCSFKGRLEAETKEEATRLFGQMAHDDGCQERDNIILMHLKLCWVVLVGDSGNLPGHKRNYEGFFKGAFAHDPEDEKDPEGLKWAKDLVDEFMHFVGWRPYPQKPVEFYGSSGILVALEWTRDDGSYIAIRRKALNPFTFEH